LIAIFALFLACRASITPFFGVQNNHSHVALAFDQLLMDGNASAPEFKASGDKSDVEVRFFSDLFCEVVTSIESTAFDYCHRPYRNGLDPLGKLSVVFEAFY
jgi:hypothetical protein